MDAIINAVVQNGLGVGSFLALIWFMNTSLKDVSNTLTKINDTLVQMQLNLSSLNARVDNLEENKRKEV